MSPNILFTRATDADWPRERLIHDQDKHVVLLLLQSFEDPTCHNQKVLAVFCLSPSRTFSDEFLELPLEHMSLLTVCMLAIVFAAVSPSLTSLILVL